MKRVKKAQVGEIVPIERKTSTPDLRTGQYRRLGRLSAKNPTKAKKVAKRMVEKATRTERGEQYLKENVGKFTPGIPKVGKKGLNLKKKMVNGGSLKPVDKAKNPGLAKLPTEVRNKMGYQKNGGKSLKKQAATAIAMKKAGKSPKKMMGGGMAKSMMKYGGSKAKKMMGGGKCRYGC